MDIERFITRYPLLYHMAEANTWESIRANGLMSTCAILDYHQVAQNDRAKYELEHRSSMMEVSSSNRHTISLRDQKPMYPSRINQGLLNGITPAEWYFFLNQKVFFWATMERLYRLLNAREYRNIEHDVLTVETASLVEVYNHQIQVCHMNSGNTFPVPHKRDYSIFKSIDDYPTKPNGDPVKEVAEVTVSHSVPDIFDFVIKVERIVGPVTQSVIYLK